MNTRPVDVSAPAAFSHQPSDKAERALGFGAPSAHAKQHAIRHAFSSSAPASYAFGESASRQKPMDTFVLIPKKESGNAGRDKTVLGEAIATAVASTISVAKKEATATEPKATKKMVAPSFLRPLRLNWLEQTQYDWATNGL